MDVALDQLDSLWPPYRGSVLLGAARESQGRVRNTRVAVTAGHVALSLEVQPPSAPAAGTTAGAARGAGSSRETRRPIVDGLVLAEESAATAPTAATPTHVDGRVCPPATAVSEEQSPTSILSLTVLLDAVPSSAPRLRTHQMARFLTKVLSRNAWPDAGNTTAAAAAAELTGQHKGVLGEAIPEMLVVEHHDAVICSEFLRFNHGPASLTVGGASTGASSNGLIYACIEASGLLRLWQWDTTDPSCRWTWRYLNCCNICACRGDPVGCRVLKAAVVPEPNSMGDNARHRLVWEQEDSGEGPGLGLASTPAATAADPRPPRRVWSRRITFDLAEGADGLWSGNAGPGAGFRSGVSGGGRLEISLAFSACLLPTEVEALLCSRFGAWMPTGGRVYFNHFATGRLPCIALPMPVYGDRGHGRSAAEAGPNSGSYGRDAHHGVGTGESDAFADSESGPGVGEATPREDDEAGREGQPNARGEAFAKETANANQPSPLFPGSRRLFAVHDTAGDLMVYDHNPCATVRVISLPSGGGGGLALRLQCTLEPPPPPPRSFLVTSNLAVFSGGGACSVYDLCTGRLLGTGSVPRCLACARRRRHQPRTNDVSLSAGLPCACGRRQAPLDGEPLGARFGAAAAVEATSPMLWTSETRGHLVGVLTATHVLRVALPRMEACLAAMLTPCSRKGSSSQPSAPSTLRYLREYKRLIGSPAAGSREASLLPKLLQMVQQAAHHTGGYGEADTGLVMMGLLGHTLAADDWGQSEAAGAPNGRSRQDECLPPWLLLAMVSAAQNHDRQQDHRRRAAGCPGFGGGDPATAATEARLREALERRVSESLRSLSSVRALLHDPAGSVRRPAADAGRGGGWRPSAEEESAGKLAAITAGVDPATALFEGTLREWLTCRRKGKGKAAALDGSGGWGGARELFEGMGGGGQAAGLGSERAAAPEVHAREAHNASGGAGALALAFRCEAAGEGETTEIPFLHLLLEDSGWADPGGGEEKRGDGNSVPPASPSPSSSTFLCLQLAGDDASPLFEIACRALFRLHPRRLPRFVERLARFRAYADGIGGEDLGGPGAEDGPGSPQGSRDDEEKEITGTQATFSRRERHRTSWSSADARSERTAGDDAGGGDGWRRDSSSTLAAEDDRRSPSPPPSLETAASRRTSEDSSALDPGGRVPRAARRTASMGASRDHSRDTATEPTASAIASTDRPLSGEADGSAQPSPGDNAPGNRRRLRKSAPVVPAYFARALACLPPAAQDDSSGNEQRRARLSLLLGACMFTEACRLLRCRAWEGSGADSDHKVGGWRGDRGAEEAWRATVRLLNELSRAAESESAHEAAAAAAAAGGAAAAATPVDAAEMETPGAGTDIPPVPGTGVHGRVSLQFRLAFEDTLAETILADSPERMRAVMLCRPSGLTPVSVVRMVRRAAKSAAESATKGGRSAAGDRVDGGDKVERNPPLHVAGSTQTLKMCLLILLEGGMRSSAV